MDQTKAVYTGMAIGGIAGFAGAVLSAFTVVALAPVAGAFVAGVAYEVKAIKKLTTDADDALPEEILEDADTVVEIIDAE